MGNAFSELNDPIDPKERFVKQVEEAQAAQKAMEEEARKRAEEEAKANQTQNPDIDLTKKDEEK